MRIRAIFKEENISKGYVPGREHVLQVLVDKVPIKHAWPLTNTVVRIVKADPSGQPVQYAGWEAFWKSWRKA